MLTPALLDRFWTALEGQGAPWLRSLAPGLSDPEMDFIAEPLPLELPAELRLWWGRHDGAAGEDAYLTPLYGFLSLRQAIELYELEREIVVDIVGEDAADEDWPPTQLPVLITDGGALTADCRPGRPWATMHLKEHTPREGWHRRIAAASLGDVIHRWAEAHENGLYRWGAGPRGWGTADGSIPEWNLSLL